MIREINHTEGMTNKEIVWVAASKWIDEIAFKAVEDADKLMENPFTATVIRQAAEQEIGYQKLRKKIAMGETEKDCWYDFRNRDRDAYSTILYDCLFHEYGANSKV